MRAGGTTLEGRLEERDDELFALRELVADVAATGTGRVVLIAGPAGIGKTSLLAALGHAADAAGYTVAAAAGAELEADLPFGVVRSLLKPLLLSGSSVDPSAPAAAALGLTTPARAPEVDAGAVLDALYWLCADLTHAAPLLLVVDDVQWSDEPSARFLTYLMRRLEGLPLLIALGRRSGGAAPVADAAERDPSCVVLRPTHLSGEATAALVRRHAPDAPGELCDAVHEASGGNPFFAIALAESARDTDAAGVHVPDLRGGAATRSILWRLGQLGHEAVAVARALAVLGNEARLQHVAQLTDLSDQRAAAGADLLVEHGFVASDPWRFAHPVIHATVLEDIAPAARSTMHACAARVLASEEADPALVASHLLATEPGQGDWARDALIAAGREALGSGAFGFAERCIAHALAASPGERRAEALALRAQAACAAGSPGAETAIAEASAAADAPGRAELALAVAFHLLALGRGERAIPLLDQAREALAPEYEELRLRLALVAAHVAGMAGDLAQQRARVTALDRGPRPAGDTETERLLLAEIAYAGQCGKMPASELVEVARRALRAPSDPMAEGTAAWALVVAGQIDEGIAATDALLRRRRAGLAEATAAVLHANRAVACLLRGRLPEAETDARLAARLCERGDLPWAREWVQSVLAIAMLLGGDVAEAVRLLAELPDRPVVDVSSAIVCNQRARLAAATAQPEHAAALLRRLGSFLDANEIVNPSWWPWRSELARMLVRLDQAEEARALAAAELELARAFGSRGATGSALVALGVATGGASGLSLLREGVAALAETEFTTSHVDSLITLGGELRRRRQAVDAREPLRAALDLAERSGLLGLAAMAEVDLRAAGSRPRRRALSGPEALTASEARVARLAAEGLTNREIARTLFVTTKTVESHLARVYRKLSVTGRGELSDALADSTQPPEPG